MLGWITADTRPCTGPPTLVWVVSLAGVGVYVGYREEGLWEEIWNGGSETERTGQVEIPCYFSLSSCFPIPTQDMKIVWSCYLNTAHSHT